KSNFCVTLIPQDRGFPAGREFQGILPGRDSGSSRLRGSLEQVASLEFGAFHCVAQTERFFETIEFVFGGGVFPLLRGFLLTRNRV
ncbi:hypothetical protein ACFL0Q_07345, partial [Thermodesulfobacteriota bacterium]